MEDEGVDQLQSLGVVEVCIRSHFCIFAPYCFQKYSETYFTRAMECLSFQYCFAAMQMFEGQRKHARCAGLSGAYQRGV